MDASDHSPCRSAPSLATDVESCPGPRLPLDVRPCVKQRAGPPSCDAYFTEQACARVTVGSNDLPEIWPRASVT